MIDPVNDLRNWRAAHRTPRVVRRADPVVRARPVRSAQPGAAPDLHPRAACPPEDRQPRLHRIVPRPSAVQGARRAFTRRTGDARRQRGNRSARRNHALAARAWEAFRAPTPEALDDAAPRRHQRAAISRAGDHAFSPGVSVDGRRALSNRAPAAAAGGGRDRPRRRVSADARGRRRLLRHRPVTRGSRGSPVAHLAAAAGARAGGGPAANRFREA